MITALLIGTIFFLPPLEDGQAGTLPDTVHLPQVEVSSERLVSYQGQLPATRADKRLWESGTLAQTLASRSPFYIKQYGPSSLATISVMGLSAHHTHVLWEGMPLQSPLNGTFDFNLTPRLSLGKTALAFGVENLAALGGAPAGSVQIEGGDFAENSSIRLATGYGSFGLMRGNLEMESVKKTASNFRFSGWFQKVDNTFPIEQPGTNLQKQVNGNAQMFGGIASWSRPLSKGRDLAVHLWGQAAERQLPPALFAQPTEENQTDRSVRALLKWTRSNHRFRFSNQSAVFYEYLKYRHKQAGIEAEYPMLSVRQKFDYQYFVSNHLKLMAVLHFARHQMLPGSDYPVSGRWENEASVQAIWDKGKRWRTAFLLKQLAFDRSFSMPLSGFSVAFRMLPGKALAFVEVNNNYRFPTLNDLYWNPGGRPDLLPEQSIHGAAGIKANFRLGEKIGVEIRERLFYNQLKDRILWMPAASGIWEAGNFGQIRTLGVEPDWNVEFQASASLLLEWGGNFQFVRAIALNSQPGGQNAALIYVPSIGANTWLNGGFRGFNLYAGWHYTGKRWLTTDRTSWLPAFNLLDVMVGKSLVWKGQTFQLDFKCFNLLNRQYFNMSSRPMPGRSFEAALAWQMDFKPKGHE